MSLFSSVFKRGSSASSDNTAHALGRESLNSPSKNLKNPNDFLHEVEARFTGRLSQEAIKKLQDGLIQVTNRCNDFIINPINGTNSLSDSILFLRSLTGNLIKEFPTVKKDLLNFRTDFLDAIGRRVSDLTTPEDVCIKLRLPLKVLALFCNDKGDTKLFAFAEKVQRSLAYLADASMTADGLSDYLVKPGAFVLAISLTKLFEILGSKQSS